jgi:hypothetical protein
VNELIERIFSISDEATFEACAMDVYRYQRQHVPVYREFIELLGRPEPKTSAGIPFLPIPFFKTHDIIAEGKSPETRFLSSGTTGMERSRHLIADTGIYRRSFTETYARFIGEPRDQVILALLPNYVDQGESSLVYMVDELVRLTENSLSGFYLDNADSLPKAVTAARESGKKIVLFGVSYALLDLAETGFDLSEVLVIETGGMKGRRKELTKEELHAELNKGFGTQFISSEYGMCELLSQAYSDKDGLFELPPWMRFRLRDINDPLTVLSSDRTGGVDIIDLANIYSCAFVSTQDLGRNIGGKLQLMGRFDHSDIRGCNLLVQ